MHKTFWDKFGDFVAIFLIATMIIAVIVALGIAVEAGAQQREKLSKEAYDMGVKAKGLGYRPESNPYEGEKRILWMKGYMNVPR